MPDESGLFRYREEFDETYNENEIRDLLNIPKNVKACDGYGHHVSCKWIIQECKPNNIYECLTQLEETAERLLNSGHKIDKAFIILDKLSKNDKRRYRIDKKTRRLYPIDGKKSCNNLRKYRRIRAIKLSNKS